MRPRLKKLQTYLPVTKGDGWGAEKNQNLKKEGNEKT